MGLASGQRSPYGFEVVLLFWVGLDSIDRIYGNG
jgi:hypothetical protein